MHKCSTFFFNLQHTHTLTHKEKENGMLREIFIYVCMYVCVYLYIFGWLGVIANQPL